MKPLRIDQENFTLTSSWRVVTGSNGVKEIVEGPYYASQTVTFNYNLPVGATVTSAIVHAKFSQPATGYSWLGINGEYVGLDDTVNVDINPAETSVNVVFSFTPNGHTNADGTFYDQTDVEGVYLLIEYDYDVCLYRAEEGALVPYQLYRAENGVLTLYQPFRAVDSELVLY